MLVVRIGILYLCFLVDFGFCGFLVWCLFVLSILGHLIIKQFLVNKLKSPISIIDNFFSLHLVKNTGGAFSILNNNVGLLSIIGIIFLILIMKYINKSKNTTNIENIGISFLLGGLLGNLLDRLIRGGVIDYLSFKILGYYFPIFNLADIFITFGVFLILINEIRGDILENRK